MYNLYIYEIKRYYKKNTIIICLSIIICFIIVSCIIQYNQAYILDLKTYTGSAKIQRDKELSKKFESLPVDDVFLNKINDYFLQITIDGMDSHKTESIPYGTSLMEYYSLFLNKSDKNSLIISLDNPSHKNTSDIWGGSSPPVYRYTENWRLINRYLPGSIFMATILCVIIISRVYSSDYSSGMSNIIKPTAKGKNKYCTVKIITAGIIATIIYIIVVSIFIIIFGIVWGLENPNADVRLFSDGSFLFSMQNITCSGLLLRTIIIGYFGILIIVAISLLVSSLLKSPYIALVVSAGLLLLPKAIPLNMIHDTATRKLLSILPSNIPDFIITNWSMYNYSSTALILIPVIYVVLIFVFALLSVKAYTRDNNA